MSTPGIWISSPRPCGGKRWNPQSASFLQAGSGPTKWKRPPVATSTTFESSRYTGCDASGARWWLPIAYEPPCRREGVRGLSPARLVGALDRWWTKPVP
eukprot:574077-Pelagomonas_calceolata.AAC.8